MLPDFKAATFRDVGIAKTAADECSERPRVSWRYVGLGKWNHGKKKGLQANEEIWDDFG